MQRLIDDLLAYSRVATMSGPMQPVDCEASVKQALRALSSQADESGATVDCDDNCPLVQNPGQEDIDGDGFADACETGAALAELPLLVTAGSYVFGARCTSLDEWWRWGAVWALVTLAVLGSLALALPAARLVIRRLRQG